MKRVRRTDCHSDLAPIFDRHPVGTIIDISSESLSASVRNRYRHRLESARGAIRLRPQCISHGLGQGNLFLRVVYQLLKLTPLAVFYIPPREWRRDELPPVSSQSPQRTHLRRSLGE
jgi:hypothetical protein